MNFYTRFLTSGIYSARGCSSQTPRVCFVSHVTLTPGWVLIRVFFFWPSTGNWAKIRGWAFFHETTVYAQIFYGSVINEFTNFESGAKFFQEKYFDVKLCRCIKDTFPFALSEVLYQNFGHSLL